MGEATTLCRQSFGETPMTVIRKTLAAAMLAAAFTGVPAMSQTAPETLTLTQEWDKIFPKSEKVEHRKVTFKNRYGITLVLSLIHI